ncbi:hypothetical protein ACP4OV_023149 [Aristida adscensionis]
MESVTVIAVPFPAQGYLNQLMHLALQLAARGLPVHYAAPPEHVRQARTRVHGWGDGALRHVRFHELPVPAYDSPAPDSAADTPFPTHLLPLWETFTAIAPAPLVALLCGLSAFHRRVIVLYDFLKTFAADEAARLPNDEASTTLAQTVPSNAGVLANTCRTLEGKFIDFFTEQLATVGKKLFVVGPLNPLLDVTLPAERWAGNERRVGDTSASGSTSSRRRRCSTCRSVPR